jgi:formylglycine-generating enzyme required for sulfatase activity
MGSADSNNQANPDEKPQHRVYLDAFWIDRTEVTNAMYRLCVQAGLCRAPSDTTYYADTQFGNYPVVNVSWNDTQTYCRWAGRQLPTQAQWEKAARGTDGRTYPWGEGLACDKANYKDCNVGHPVDVGSYPDGASPFGALDMAGNIFEWVADWYSESYYSGSPPSNPQGPDSGQYRVIRGGSWLNVPQDVRAANLGRLTPDKRYGNLGFRCSR